MARTVTIDCFPESVPSHADRDALVAIDVIRATTTAVTAVARGRDCYPVPSIDATVPLAARLNDPLLVGELGGSKPFGFHLNNSPADIEERDDISRPAILLSTSGTRVICQAREGQPMYVACLRNYCATARTIASRHESVTLIGAGSRGEFRDEDQLCCAWLCQMLLEEGFQIGSNDTRSVLKRWQGSSVQDILPGHSAQYLIRSGQVRDLDFVMTHIDDLDTTFCYDGERIVDGDRAVEEPAA